MAQKVLDINIKGLKELKKTLDPKKLARAERNAVNATATAVAKLGADEAANEYNLKKARIKKDSKGKALIRKKKARAGEDQASVFFGTDRKGDRPGLQNFGPNKAMVNKKKSPKVKVKKRESLKTVDRGFFLKNAGPRRKATGLFQREGEKRNPIARRTGPSTKQMVEDPKVFKHIRDKGGKILEKKTVEAIDKQLKKGR